VSLATLDYAAFLEAKTHLGGEHGFSPIWMPDFLFDFQRVLVEWATRRGRGAIFADCGLGKTPMQLVWAENVVRRTNRPVLIIAPLAVSSQTIVEGEKFGIGVRRSLDGTAHAGITITNYERLHHFTPSDFAGAVCDESSAIKSFNGKHRALVTAFMRRLEYRLLATATAAPNDYTELGTSSEALGELGLMDMLGRFFRNTQNTADTRYAWRTHGGARPAWRFKGHAASAFWRWVCSWARSLRRPSDLGFDDGAFRLPPLLERQHLVTATTREDGMLFDLPAIGLWEERRELRRTLTERCGRVAELVNATGQPAVVWCHLNAEGHLLARLIPDARQVSGADATEAKEEALLAFSAGQVRVLITKPKIGAWGLNWQHCAHMVCFPSHSFESYYQAVRRCWRFGQARPVVVDIVTTESGATAMQNLQRKAQQADRMFSALVAHMGDALAVSRSDGFTQPTESPAWL
jgi:hypothetical protein